MSTREENARRTAQSIADGFGGDTYRRREVSPGVYQCGCRVHRDLPEAVALGVRGDVLMLCAFHEQINSETYKSTI